MNDPYIVSTVPVPSDSTPPVDDYDDVDISNVVPLAAPPSTDDPEAPYGRTKSGRIRKRPVGSARRGASGPRGGNEVLARQAASLLAQANGLITTGLFLTGFPRTASAIAERNEPFEAQVTAALIADPALCRTILRAGGTSAKLSLLVAYGMLAGSVAPVALEEYRDMRSRRADEEE